MLAILLPFYLLFSGELQHCEINIFFPAKKKVIFTSKDSLELEAETQVLKESTWSEEWTRGVMC